MLHLSSKIWTPTLKLGSCFMNRLMVSWKLDYVNHTQEDRTKYAIPKECSHMARSAWSPKEEHQLLGQPGTLEDVTPRGGPDFWWPGNRTSGVLDDAAMLFAYPTAMFLLLPGAWPGSTGESGVLENCLGDICKDLSPGMPWLLKAQELWTTSE